MPKLLELAARTLERLRTKVHLPKKVHIIAMPREFSSREKMLERIAEVLEEFKGKPTLLLMPECVLGDKPLARSEGKKLAREVSELLAKHGSAHAAYSLLEKHHYSPDIITNTGYLVSRKTDGRKTSWQAYPKNTTMNYNDGKLTLGAADKALVEKHLKYSNEEALQKITRNWHDLTMLVTRFPRVTVEGKEIELRVCADSLRGTNFNLNPAQKSTARADAILVPASNYGPPEFTAHLPENMRPGGFAVIADKFHDAKTFYNCRPAAHLMRAVDARKGSIGKEIKRKLTRNGFNIHLR